MVVIGCRLIEAAADVLKRMEQGLPSSM